MGIDEVKELALLGAALAHGVDEGMADGEWSMGDLVALAPVITLLPKALDGVGKIPAEMKDLSAAEKADLEAYIADHFDLANDHVEEVVEKSLAIGLGIVQLLGVLRKE